jgi:hypothetical protein
MQASDFEERGSPGVITGAEKNQYMSDRHGRRRKRYDECVKRESDRVIASEDIQSQFRSVVSSGLADHGENFIYGETGAVTQNVLRGTGKRLEGSKIGLIFGQIPAFLYDVNRTQEIANLLNP